MVHCCIAVFRRRFKFRCSTPRKCNDHKRRITPPCSTYPSSFWRFDRENLRQAPVAHPNHPPPYGPRPKHPPLPCVLRPAAGRQFYDVESDETLGEGQFGTVSTATDRVTGEVVAVKCVPRSKASEAHFREEADVHREVANHPNVVGLKVCRKLHVVSGVGCGLGCVMWGAEHAWRDDQGITRVSCVRLRDIEARRGVRGEGEKHECGVEERYIDHTVYNVGCSTSECLSYSIGRSRRCSVPAGRPRVPREDLLAHEL